VTDPAAAGQPLAHFHRNPPGRGQLAVFPRCSLLTYPFRYARRSRLKNSQLADGETHVSYGTGHLNQSLRDPAAKDTIGLHPLPQLPGESVNEFCLPPASGKPSARQAVFDLIGRNARRCSKHLPGLFLA
jgi:hypothetical protein